MDADRLASSISPTRRYLILASVVVACSLYSTALLTTSTILPQMQGAMSATQDEIAWAMTFNILATAVVTPMTGWLVARFGSKTVMVWGILSFSLATLMCGLSQSLEMLVLWRIVQGGVGAPVVPLSQTILLDSFPRRQHAMVLSIFGMAVGVSPVIGPVLGGYLAEAYSWRWSFHMLVPVGLAAFVGLRLALIADTRVARDSARLDRIPGARHRHGRRPAGAGPRRAPRLVPVDGDHRRVPGGGAGLLHLHRALPDEQSAVPEFAPARPIATTRSAWCW